MDAVHCECVKIFTIRVESEFLSFTNIFQMWENGLFQILKVYSFATKGTESQWLQSCITVLFSIFLSFENILSLDKIIEEQFLIKFRKEWTKLGFVLKKSLSINYKHNWKKLFFQKKYIQI